MLDSFDPRLFAGTMLWPESMGRDMRSEQRFCACGNPLPGGKKGYGQRYCRRVGKDGQTCFDRHRREYWRDRAAMKREAKRKTACV